MRSRGRETGHELASWRALGLVAACFLAACATGGSKQSGRIEFQEGGGFTITEQAKFSSGVRKDFEKALRLVEEEEYEGGIELLERVTEVAPHATAAYIDLGIAYRLKGAYELAESSFQRALELNPRHPVAHNELGIAYRKMGRFEEARESYTSALEISPAFHFARRNLAILCDVYIGDLVCALESYELYASMVPDDEQVAMWIEDLRNRVGK